MSTPDDAPPVPLERRPPYDRPIATVTLGSGLRLSCVEQGDVAAPCVVFLPGPTDSWRSYRPVLERLPADVRAIAVSPRGHGESDKPDAGYGIADFAGDLVQLLDAMDVARAVLAGHSASCLVARRVALDHPERVAGLVLEGSPATLAGDAALEAFVRTVLADLDDPISADFARSWVTDTSSAGLDPDLAELMIDDVRAVPPHVWREMFAAILDYDDRSELGRIAAPALLVWGDDDTLVDRIAQDELHRLIPHAELVVHDGAGHSPRLDDPARFAADVATFVRRITAS